MTGPGQFNIDGSLVKSINITEKVAVKLTVEAFNMINNMSWERPSTSVTSGSFGKSTNQAYLLYGRRLQLGARIEF